MSAPAVAALLPPVFPFDWAGEWGEDRYGPWVAFRVKGVRQCLRWVPPGRFLMGSPAGEAQRSTDEAQHWVTLTQGLWLADTACTQALWQAVMGENPSRFQGAQRPVEQVDWDQVQQFIGRLNDLLPGLDACLPTEAQWEHACRAGTRTPFWFGDQITPEQVNYDGNHPYPGGAKGLYREQTVEVRALPCNAWGLYQMHGNVWEWCRDWYGDYPTEPIEDPTGPETGLRRVARGGCWIDRAGHCRSARRSGRGPADRNDGLGFRLARGP
ncbi:formylglycine-generating enzyme family protein [uncultured Thiodictyon sp.]|uniref:formylglycine-generating enzyme family protein n=1 Tax=uncultured Thiodictyon sp. TaxID=1846217 RepID=UPI0025CC7E63|nr:formylglycine-generating enzyme family protein [uncultured Thiodictyon sp.]